MTRLEWILLELSSRAKYFTPFVIIFNCMFKLETGNHKNKKSFEVVFPPSLFVVVRDSITFPPPTECTYNNTNVVSHACISWQNRPGKNGAGMEVKTNRVYDFVRLTKNEYLRLLFV